MPRQSKCSLGLSAAPMRRDSDSNEIGVACTDHYWSDPNKTVVLFSLPCCTSIGCGNCSPSKRCTQAPSNIDLYSLPWRTRDSARSVCSLQCTPKTGREKGGSSHGDYYKYPHQLLLFIRIVFTRYSISFRSLHFFTSPSLGAVLRLASATVFLF